MSAVLVPIQSGSAIASTPAVAATVRGAFVPITPTRVLDTRAGIGASKGAIKPDGVVPIKIAGDGAVPATGVGAIVANLTVTGPTKPGYLVAYPAGAALPGTSNINFLAGQTKPNAVLVKLGTNGAVDVANESTGTSQIVLDVTGYYLAGAPKAPGTFIGLTPARLLDTRQGIGSAKAAVPPGGSITLVVDGRGGVPDAGVSASALNITVTGPTAAGYVTAYPGGDRPATSTVNFQAGQTAANLAVTALGTHGDVTLYNGSAGPVQIIADVFGYFGGGPAVDSGTLITTPPARVLDTRNGTGTTEGSVPPNGNVHLALTGSLGAYPGASAAVLNVTYTQAAAPGYVTVFPDGGARPGTSTLNLLPGQTAANLVVVGIGPDGDVDLFNGSAGKVDLIADIVGYVTDGSLGAVSGTVTDSASHPVGDVSVSVNEEGGGAEQTVQTNADGTFAANGLPAGTYVACFYPGQTATGGTSTVGYVGQCYNDQPLQAGVNDFVVTAGHATTHIDAALAVGAAETGRVTDSSGNPLAGITVDQSYPGSQTSSAVTNAAGVYRIVGLSDPNAEVCAESSLLLEGSSHAGYLAACDTTSPSLTPGTVTTVPDIQMPSAVGVSGRITDAAGHPLKNVAVNWAPAPATLGSLSFPAAAFTAADGTYSILGLTPGGSINVCFAGRVDQVYPGGDLVTIATGGTSTTGYQDACYRDLPPITLFNQSPTLTAIPLPAAGGVTTGVNQALAAGAAVSGVVRNPSGAPLAGVQVNAYSETHPNTGGALQTNTAADGTYRLNNLTPGPYQICFYATPGDPIPPPTGYLNQCYPGVEPGSPSSTFLNLQAGVVTSGINATLNGGGTITGTVTDTSGDGIAGVVVSTADNVSATTDAHGDYTLSYVYAGPATVCFDASRGTGGTSGTGYANQCWSNEPDRASATPITVTAGATVSGIDAHLTPAAGISVLVTDTTGDPLSNAEVCYFVGAQINSGSCLATPTGADGTVEIKPLQPGTYAICIQSNFGTITGGTSVTGYAPSCYGKTDSAAFAPVTIADGAATPVTVALTALSGSSGKITAHTGNELGQGRHA